MEVEIVVVGNELLNGDLADTNTSTIAGILRTHGLGVHRAQTVPDEVGAVVDALALAASRSGLVLVTGGLGPTDDDLTIRAASEFAGVDLVEHGPTLEQLRARFAERDLPFTENNARQAMVPEGARVLFNPVGTAPGVELRCGEATLFFFPGVPRELKRLAADHLLPWLEDNAGARAYESRVFKTFGRFESQVAALLGDLSVDPGIHVAYRAHFPEIHVSLHARGPVGDGVLEALAAQVRERLGRWIFTEDGREPFAAAVGRILVAARATVATAESCTGGLIAKLLTDTPGSSEYFVEGVVTYANESKVRRLGIPAELLEERGAVCEEVARAMAEGVRRAARTTFGVGTTGIAGPGGGTETRPVGTVHIAVAGPGGTIHKQRSLPFDRERNRIATAYVALDVLRKMAAG